MCEEVFFGRRLFFIIVAKLKNLFGSGVVTSSSKKGGLPYVRVTKKNTMMLKPVVIILHIKGGGWGRSVLMIRGVCLVNFIEAELTLPNGDGGNLICTP